MIAIASAVLSLLALVGAFLASQSISYNVPVRLRTRQERRKAGWVAVAGSLVSGLALPYPAFTALRMSEENAPIWAFLAFLTASVLVLLVKGVGALRET